MEIIETRLKKWGNSFGVVIPVELINKERMKENEHVKIILVKDSRDALRKTFGIGKGRLKKTGQEFKDEVRRELYND
ncbi:MAG: AbrB/MazE/SpoVT family DNA-binding domain-containing protein [Nanoarchaeota archaeon]